MKTSIANLTHEDVDRILEIVNGLQDVDLHLQVGDLSLHVRKGDAAPALRDSGRPVPPPVSTQALSAVNTSDATTSPSASAPAPIASPTGSTPMDAANLTDIVAPMMGRFYRASSPNDPPFVEVGTQISSDDTVCILEVMKLFNTVRSGEEGTVAEILVRDGEMVEEGTVLFRVRPQ